MTVRIFTRTTPGKPILAAAIMAGLLALAGLAAWSVSFYRAHQVIQLGDRRPLGEPQHPGEPRPMGDSTTIAPPAGWAVNPYPKGGAIAEFAESDGAMLTRRLRVYHEPSNNVISPAWLIRELYQEQLGAVSFSAGVQIGPLPARQTLVIFNGPEGLAKELVRVAAVGRRDFLILRLICVGPPTDYELNLMDQVARSVQLDPGLYLPADTRARQIGVRLGPQAGSWLALSQAQSPDDSLTLLPAAGGGGKSSAPGFWGAIRIRKEYARPGADLKLLLADRLSNPLASLLGGSAEPDEWNFARAGNKAGPSTSLLVVEQRKVAALAVSQIRWVDHDRDIVRLRCAFRPALLQAGAEGDSAGPPTSPGGGASPVPAAVSSKQAIVLDAWADAADEPAATAAIDELIQSLRLPRE